VLFLSVRLASRASAEKFPGGGQQKKKDRKIAKKTENTNIKPLPLGGGRMEKIPEK